MTSEPDFQVMPDPADVTFDGSGTPVLTFEQSHAGGPGWVLHCPDEGGEVASHYLGGDSDDPGWAEEAATEKLLELTDQDDR